MSSVLECIGVEKTYIDGERELHILRGIDLKVPEGEVTSITGSSGAGKSTLLHLMGTLDKPSGGEILLRGEPLTAYSREQIDRIRNQDIGFVFQFYHLLSEFSALENVMMPGLARASPAPNAGAAPWNCSTASGSPNARPTSPDSSPAANNSA